MIKTIGPFDMNQEVETEDIFDSKEDTGTSLENGEDRTIQTVTFEIKSLHAQAQQMMLNYAIEIGRRLTEAKAILDHGQWGEWLKNEVSFSKSTANNLMRIFDEYGDRQMCLFGTEAKSQAIGNLPYTKALKLLAVPEDERDDFLENHDVAEMSSRELEKAIKERNEAQQLQAKIQEEKNKLEEQAETASLRVSDLEKDLVELQDIYVETERELNEMRSLPKEVAIEKVTDEEAIQRAKEEVEESMLHQMKEVEKAKEDAEERLLKRLEELEEAKEQAELEVKEAKETLEKMSSEKASINETLERDKKQAEERAEELEKQLATVSSQDVAIFKVHFEGAQEHINKMIGIYQAMEESNNEEGANKLKAALANVLESTLQMVN